MTTDPGYPTPDNDPATTAPLPAMEFDDSFAPPDDPRHRRLGRAALDKLFSKMVTSDIRKGAGHEMFYLVGYDEPSAHTGIRPDTSNARFSWTPKGSPAAGPNYPKMPWIGHTEVELYGPDGEEGEHASNLHHPLYRGLRDSIADGDFRGALRSHKRIVGLVDEAEDTFVGPVRRWADRRVSDEYRRENYVSRMREDLSHDVYREVLSVPNIMPAGVDNDGEPRYVEDTRDWGAVLDLSNIQALRAHLMTKWQTNGTTVSQAHAQFEAGGAFNLDGLSVSRYLGVPFQELRQQVEGGPVVVPPQVLAKMNFFLSYADDTVPEGGISDRLAELNNVIGSDRTPINRIYDGEHEAGQSQVQLGIEDWAGKGAGVYVNKAALARHRARRGATSEADTRDTAPTADTVDVEALQDNYLTNVQLSRIDAIIQANTDAYVNSLPPRDSLTDDEVLDAEDAETRQRVRIHRQTVHDMLVADFPDGIPQGLEGAIIEGLRRRAQRLEELRKKNS